MIRTLKVTKSNEVVVGSGLEDLNLEDCRWVWVDFNMPTSEEEQKLRTYFHFHPLAIEDCVLNTLQRLKLDHYDSTRFYILHAVNPDTLNAVEVNLFVEDQIIVSFHKQELDEVDQAWEQITQWAKDGQYQEDLSPMTVAYSVMDHLVDAYFPCVFMIEDELADLELLGGRESVDLLMSQVFSLRSRLLKLRRTIVPMLDLLYRIINLQHVQENGMHRAYFSDVHDHLLKLADMIEADREMTADLRDSYISINSNRMNGIMKTLTVITTIFMPLTLIAGIYGMNFDKIPELHWKYGYFTVLLLMVGLTLWMILWFKSRGWFK